MAANQSTSIEPRADSPASATLRLLGRLGRRALGGLGALGRASLFVVTASARFFTPPNRLGIFAEQIVFIGVRSASVILLTAGFTGMVLTLQGTNALARFGSETLVGAVVALSLTRELSPVLGALMVAARGGSAIAATIATMRVTDQIDALRAMAVDPVKYLVSPRIAAAIVALPIVAVLFSLIGLGAGYGFGVSVLGLDGASFLAGIRRSVAWSDVTAGLIKALVFGLIIGAVATYRGHFASGGALGVGRATTRAVVQIAVMVLSADYLMTALLF